MREKVTVASKLIELKTDVTETSYFFSPEMVRKLTSFETSNIIVTLLDEA